MEKVRITHVEARLVIFLTSLKVIRVKNGCAFGSPEQRNVRSGHGFCCIPATQSSKNPPVVLPGLRGAFRGKNPRIRRVELEKTTLAGAE